MQNREYIQADIKRIEGYIFSLEEMIAKHQSKIEVHKRRIKNLKLQL